MTLPNFLGLGMNASGSTWLYENLSAHPQVWLPPEKELHYFDQEQLNKKGHRKRRIKKLKDMLDGEMNGYEVSPEVLKFYSDYACLDGKMGKNWYKKLFAQAPDDAIAVGEITPRYAMLPNDAIGKIKDTLGSEIKLIMMVRNPINRAFSQMVKINRRLIRKFGQPPEEAFIDSLDHEEIQLRNDTPQLIRNYLKVFKPEQFFYGNFDLLEEQPLLLLQNLCEFLEIPYQESHFAKTARRKYNLNAKRYSFSLEDYPNLKARLTEIYQAECDELAALLGVERLHS